MSYNTTSYSYNTLHQLTTEQRLGTNTYKYTYWYDSIGNRTTMVYNTSTTVYGYNTLNQVTAVYAGDTHYYGYDENGNRSNEVVYIGGLAHLYSYDYDADNRLINKRTQGGGGGVSYTYCGLGKRVMKVKDGNTTIYYPDGLNTVVEMYKGSTWSEFSITAVYTLAPGAIGQIISVRQYGATTTDLYYHYDPIGNVQFITDSYGNTTVSYVQEGFGNVIATLGSLTSNFYHLTTKELDPDTGLYYFGGRWYDPVIGRWITKSPLRPDVEHPYGYVENDPINLTDSNGLVADYIWDIGVVGYDIYSLYKEPSWENAGYLGLDVVLGVIPFVPSGVGPAAKGIKCGVKLSKAEKIDNLTKLARLKYPKLAGKTHLHHVRPFYLGGTRKGATVAIDAAYHQMITNAIRKEFPYGKSWKEQFNEDLLKEIYEKYPLPK